MARARALSLCLAGAALLFAPELFGGRSTLGFDHRDPRLDLRPWVEPALDATAPLNPVLPDPGLFVLPGLLRLRQLDAAGGGLWWDRGQLLGHPLAANLPAPVFHPLLWLTWGLDPVTALDVLLWLHTAAAALLGFRAARLLGAGPAAAALAAPGCALSDWMVLHWGSPPMAATAAWLPGLLCAWGWLRQGRRRRGLVEGAVFGALALVSGFPQLGVIALGGFGLLVGSDRVARGGRGGLAAGCALVLAGALAAPQFVVSGAAYAESLRSDPVTRRDTLVRGLQPAALAQLVLPRFFGNPQDFAGPDPPAATMEDWLPLRRLLDDPLQNNVVELSLYPGLLVLLLLPGLLRRGAPAAGARLAWLGLLALVLTLAWPWLARAAPGLDVLAAGNVKRVLVLAAMAWPVAAALGLQRRLEQHAGAPLATAALVAAALVLAPLLAERLDDPQAATFAADLAGQARRQAGVLALSVLALLLALRGARAGDAPGAAGWAAWLPALVLGGELAAGAAAFHAPPPQLDPPFAETRSVAALRAAGGRYAVLGEMNWMLPMPAAALGLSALHGAAPMVPRRAAELLACIEGPLHDPREPRVVGPLTDPAALDHPLLDLLDVRAVVFGDPALLAAQAARPLLFSHPEEGLAAWSRPGAGPFAFLGGGAELLPDPAARLARLADPGFDPHATVLVERPLRQALPARGPAQPLPVGRATDDALGLELHAERAGVLVVAEAWDPGWTATLDGRPAEVLVAHHALLGLELEPGIHQVVFRYAPPGLAGATGVSLAALLLLVVAALAGRGRAPAAR